MDMKKQKDREKEEEAERQQVRTFTNWANLMLKERGIKIDSVLTDFESGVNLIALVETITRQSLGKYSKEPVMRVHKIENNSKVINFLIKNEGINLVNMSGSDITDGNKKIILGLMWMLILVYQVQDNGGTKSGGGGGGGGGAKAELLEWVNSKIGITCVGYGYDVTNFTTDWNDGKKIMALMYALGAGDTCADHKQAGAPMDKARRAIVAGDQVLDCPPLVAAEDMTSPNVDELAMITYLSYLKGLDGRRKKKVETATPQVVVVKDDSEAKRLQAELEKAAAEQKAMKEKLAAMEAQAQMAQVAQLQAQQQAALQQQQLAAMAEQEKLRAAAAQQELLKQQMLLQQQQLQLLQQQVEKQKAEAALAAAKKKAEDDARAAAEAAAARKKAEDDARAAAEAAARLKAQQDAVVDVDDDDDDVPARPVAVQSGPPTVVLIVGESGHGKSTFINTVANYFLQGKATKLRVVIKTKYLPQTETRFAANQTNERDAKNTSQSQTDNCFAYDFVHPKDGRRFVWIDTPGLGDTRGMGQDEVNIQKIVDFAATMGSLAGIVIIINGMVSRLTTHMKKTLVTLRAHIPNVMMENIVIVFTMCSNRSRTFDLMSLKELGEGFNFQLDLTQTSHIYHTQNSFFASDPRKWNEEDVEEIEREYAQSMVTVDKIVNKVGNLVQVNTQVFNDMKDMRNDIKSSLHRAKLELNRLQRLQDDLISAEKALGDSAEDASAYRNYIKKTKVKRVIVIPDKGYHSTVCSQCNTTCHEKCGLNEVQGGHAAKNKNIFINCYAMNGADTCRRCPGGCHYTFHYHSRQAIQEIETDVVTEIEDMKKRFVAAQQGQQQAQGQIDYVQAAKEDTERAVNQLIEEFTKECQRLKGICAGFNFVDELAITIAEMKRDAEKLRSKDTKEAAYRVIRALETVATNLSK